MGSQIVSKIQENGTPLVVVQEFAFGDGTGVLSVRIKNDKKGPQTGDVVLELDDAVISLLEWDPDYEYLKNNVCLHEDGEKGRMMLYRAIVPYPTKGEFIASEWEELDYVDIIAEDFKPNFPYQKDQICIVNHMFYRAKEDFVSGLAFDIKDWEEIGGATIDEYQMGMHINRWQPIIHDGALYRAIDDFTSTVAGNLKEAWNLDKEKFEEIKSGDSHWVVESDDLDYLESDKTFSFTKTYYQLSSGKLVTYQDNIIHDETLEVIKTTTAKGIDVQIKVPTFSYDKLGVIRGAKILPDPHYRGEMAQQGQMDVIKNPKIGDFCDRLDTNTEWTYNGDLWVNSGQPLNTTPHEKIPDNYVQADSDGFGFVNITSENLLRLATNSEAAGRISNEVATSPLHLSLYGGNLRQIDTYDSLPEQGLPYDLYYLLDEKRFYIWDEDFYRPLDVEVEDFLPYYEYPKNTLISYQGRIYRANESFVSESDFNGNDWSQLGKATVDDFQPNIYYNQGDIIYWNGTIYRAPDNFVASDFYESDWESITPDQSKIVSGEEVHRYIDSNIGTDTVNSGTIDNPYLTLEYAISELKQYVQTSGSTFFLHFTDNLNYEFAQGNLFSNLNNISLEAPTTANIVYTGTDELQIEYTNNLSFNNLNLEVPKINIDLHSESILFRNLTLTSSSDDYAVSSEGLDVKFDTVTITGAKNPLITKNNGTTEINNLTCNQTNNPLINNDEGTIIAINRVLGVPDDITILSNIQNSIGFYNRERIQDYEKDTYYPKYAQVCYKGLYYRAKDIIVSGPDFNPDEWELIEPIVKEFAKSQYYAKGQLINVNGEIYQAKNNFTSESDFDIRNWTLIADTTRFNPFRPNWEYKEGEVIYFNNAIYIVRKDFTSNSAFSESDWYTLGGSGGSGLGIGEYQSHYYYQPGTLIFKDDKIYKAKYGFKSESDWYPNDWELVADHQLKNFTPNYYYEKNELIYFEGTQYRAKYPFISESDFAPTDWEKISTSSTTNFESNKYYPEGTIIIQDNRVYYANQDFYADSDWDETKWNLIGPEYIKTYQQGQSYLEGELTVYKQRLYKALENMENVSGIFDYNKWLAVDESAIRNYVPNQFYPEGAIVFENSAIWRSRLNGVADSDFNPDQWERLTISGASEYEDNTYYAKDTFVLYQGRLYRAKEDFTSASTWDANAWIPVNASQADNFESDSYYPKNSLVVDNGIIYRAKENFFSESDFDPNDWEQIGGAGVAEFEPNKYYAEGTLITYNNKVYYAKKDFTSSSSFNPSDWTPVGATSLNWFESDKFYGAGDTIVEDDRLYRAKTDFTSGSTFNSKDWEWLLTGYDYWFGDLNKQVTQGLYILSQTSTNAPDYYKTNNTNCVLTVSKSGSTIKQGITRPGDKSYTRTSTNNGTTWTKWGDTFQGDFVESVTAVANNATSVNNTNPRKPIISTRDASTTQSGVVRIATPAEIQAGTSNSLVVTPYSLSQYLFNPVDSDSDAPSGLMDGYIPVTVAGGTTESDSTLLTDIDVIYNPMQESDLILKVYTTDPFNSKLDEKNVDIPYRKIDKEGLMRPSDVKEMLQLREDVTAMQNLGHYVGTVDLALGGLQMYVSDRVLLGQGGTDYVVGDILTVYGDKESLTIRVTKVSDTGAILSFTITGSYNGFHDIAGTSVEFSGGTGIGARFEVTTTAPTMTVLDDLKLMVPQGWSINDYAYVRYYEEDAPNYRSARFIWTEGSDGDEEWKFDSFISNEFVARAENITETYPGAFGVIKGSKLNDGTDLDACYIDEQGVPRVNGFLNLAAIVDLKVSSSELSSVAYTGSYNDLSDKPAMDNTTTEIRKTDDGDHQGQLLAVGAGGNISNPDSFDLVDPAELFSSIGFVQRINNTLRPDSRGNVIVAKEVTTAQYNNLTAADKQKPIIYFETDSNKSLVEEAPVDNIPYERRNGEWIPTNLFQINNTLTEISTAEVKPAGVAGKDILWFEQI